MKIEKKALIFTLVMLMLVIVVMIVWHPWVKVSDEWLQSMEEELKEAIPYANISLEKSWCVEGVKVVIRGGIENLTYVKLPQIGYFIVDFSGHTDYIYINMGNHYSKIPAWWEMGDG